MHDDSVRRRLAELDAPGDAEMGKRDLGELPRRVGDDDDPGARGLQPAQRRRARGLRST